MSQSGIGRVGTQLPGQSRNAVVLRKIDYREITTPQRGRELYNPSDEEVIAEFIGERFTFPPSTVHLVFYDPFRLDMEGEPRKSYYPKPGVCPVRDYTVTVHGQRYPYKAEDIIKFFCGDDGRSGTLSALGIRPLFGDERDEQVKVEAHEAWAAGKDEEAFRLTRDHEAMVAAARDNGDPAPRPGPKVMWGYEWIESRSTEVLLPFSCPVCNLGFKVERESLTHVVTRHKKHPAAQDAARALNLTGPTGNVAAPAAPGAKVPTEEDVKAALQASENNALDGGLGTISEETITREADARGPGDEDDDDEEEETPIVGGEGVPAAPAPGIPAQSELPAPPPAPPRAAPKNRR